MIFDQYGLPKDTGASDYMDSARLAGIMAVFDIPGTPDLYNYIAFTSERAVVGVRHPHEFPSNNPNNFTRDQLMCLTAGIRVQKNNGAICDFLYAEACKRGNRAQNMEADVPGSLKKFPNGADLLLPSNMDHLRRCAGHEPTFLGTLWLKADIIANGLFTPLGEQNQLICMCVVAGPEYVKMYKKCNKQWRDAIRLYWCGWRQEPELAEIMIKKLETY